MIRKGMGEEGGRIERGVCVDGSGRFDRVSRD